MTNSQTLGTIEATNPVLAVAPLKEETDVYKSQLPIKQTGK